MGSSSEQLKRSGNLLRSSIHELYEPVWCVPQAIDDCEAERLASDMIAAPLAALVFGSYYVMVAVKNEVS